MKEKEKFYKEQLKNYPLETIKKNIDEKASSVWDDMSVKRKLIVCIKLEMDGDIKKENDEYV